MLRRLCLGGGKKRRRKGCGNDEKCVDLLINKD